MKNHRLPVPEKMSGKMRKAKNPIGFYMFSTHDNPVKKGVKTILEEVNWTQDQGENIKKNKVQQCSTPGGFVLNHVSMAITPESRQNK